MKKVEKSPVGLAASKKNNNQPPSTANLAPARVNQNVNFNKVTIVPPHTGTRAITVQTDLQTLVNNDQQYGSNYHGSAIDAESYKILKDS